MTRVASAISPSMPTLKAKRTPSFSASSASACVNMWQSPVSSCGKRKPAGDLVRHVSQCRLGGNAAGAIEHLERHAILLEHRDIVGGVVELGRIAKQLQRAALALVIANADLAAQRAQAVAAVFGDRDHPPLVDRIALRRAVAQHLQQPDPHHGIELRPDHQRAVLHQQPFDRLDRHAGPRPWRGIAGRHLAGIGKAGLQRRLRLTVDDRYLMAGLGEIIGRGDADDATAENKDFHDPSCCCRGIVRSPQDSRCRG